MTAEATAATKKRYNFTLDGDAYELLSKLAKRRRASRSNVLEELVRLAAAKEGVK